MKIIKTALWLLCVACTGYSVVYAASNTLSATQLKKLKPLKKNEGRTLMSLSKAKLKDVHLAKNVKYFDIKSYEINFDKLKYSGGWSFDMEAYNKLSKREKKKIRSVKPIKSNTPFGAIYFADSPMKEIYNLHYIDARSKVHTFASRKALLAFLGEIDTPAEVHMALLNSFGSIRYKKVGNLYVIREKSVTYEDYDGGKYDSYVEILHKVMDNRGKILLSKRVKYQGCRKKRCDNLPK